MTTEKDMTKVESLFPVEIDIVALSVTMEIRGLDRLLEYIENRHRTIEGTIQRPCE